MLQSSLTKLGRLGICLTVATATLVSANPASGASSLRDAATARGITVGVAVDAYSLQADPAYAAAVAANFNSVTPENAMKLVVTRPTARTWNFGDADAIVAFAQQNGMSVRGTALIWGQASSDGIPRWLANITRRSTFKTEFLNSINGEMAHFKGVVNRWDVVNEPFEYASGRLDNNLFVQRIGTGYIDLAFRTARKADPKAELWLNETNTEYIPAKAVALIQMVATMKRNGVPIDGVGLQTHLIAGDPAPGSVASLAAWLRALGVKVAITELDVPTGAARTPATAAALYGQVAGELLSVGGTEITVWGVNDPHSWLDYPPLRAVNQLIAKWALPSQPLILDANYAPKDSYFALLAAIG